MRRSSVSAVRPKVTRLEFLVPDVESLKISHVTFEQIGSPIQPSTIIYARKQGPLKPPHRSAIPVDSCGLECILHIAVDDNWSFPALEVSERANIGMSIPRKPPIGIFVSVLRYSPHSGMRDEGNEGLVQ